MTSTLRLSKTQRQFLEQLLEIFVILSYIYKIYKYIHIYTIYGYSHVNVDENI